VAALVAWYMSPNLPFRVLWENQVAGAGLPGAVGDHPFAWREGARYQVSRNVRRHPLEIGMDSYVPYMLPYIIMKKTSIYLEDVDVQRLRRLAERTGRSQATIVREAIEAYELHMKPDRAFALTASGSGDGRSVADISKEELFEGFGS
jgi:predicted DNA-binding protein